MVKFDHVSFAFGDKAIFSDFTYEFPKGTITAVMAPSGSGKTTMLHLILGNIKPQSGTVTRPEKIAVSFQEPRLLPWFSVEENLNVVLAKKKQRGLAAAEKEKHPVGNMGNKKQKVVDYLKEVHLESELKSRPDALSGGMQKRVSLARALCYLQEEDAELLLLDEPFSGLDADLHAEMRNLVKASTEGKTVILITHDESDLCIADQCLRL